MDKWIHFDYGDGTEVYMKGDFEGNGFSRNDFSNENGKAIYVANYEDGVTVTEVPFGKEFKRLTDTTSSYLNYAEYWDELDNDFSYDRYIKYLEEKDFLAIDDWSVDNSTFKENILTTTIAHTQTEATVQELSQLLKENGIDIDEAHKEGQKYHYLSENVLETKGENGIFQLFLSPERLSQAIADIENEEHCKVETVPKTSYTQMTNAVFLAKNSNGEANLVLVTLNNNAHYQIPLSPFEKEVLGELHTRLENDDNYVGNRYTSLTAYPEADEISEQSKQLFQLALSFVSSHHVVNCGEWEVAMKYPSLDSPEVSSPKDKTIHQMYDTMIAMGTISEFDISFAEFEKKFQAIETITEEEFRGTYTNSQIFSVNENGTVEFTTNTVEKDEAGDLLNLQSNTTTISAEQAIDELRSSIENVKNYEDGDTGVYLKTKSETMPLRSYGDSELVIGVFRRGEPCLEISPRDGRVTGDKNVAEALMDSIKEKLHRSDFKYESAKEPKKSKSDITIE